MKKTLLLLVTMIMCIALNAQHLAFLSTPIDGSIDSFARVMKTKGFAVATKNKDARMGLRIMTGRFYNQDAEIWISYTPSTKMVYAVRVVFCSKDSAQLAYMMSDLKNAIESKYDFVFDKGVTNANTPIDVYRIQNTEKNGFVGDIFVGIAPDALQKRVLNLNLTYEDAINSKLNDASENKDI